MPLPDAHALLEDHLAECDVVYASPPRCWQDGMFLGNGGIGVLYFASQALHFLVNKTDVLDGRVHGVRRVIPPDEARDLVRAGASAGDFDREERGVPAPEGYGPKTCGELILDIATRAGSGQRSATAAIASALRLRHARLEVSLDKHLCHPRLTAFVSALHNVLAVRVVDVSPFVAPQSRIYLRRPVDAALPAPRVEARQGLLFLSMRMPKAPSYTIAVGVRPLRSRAYRETHLDNVRPKVRPPELGTPKAGVVGLHGVLDITGDFELFLTVVSSADCDGPGEEAARRLEIALETGFSRLQDEHRQWWHEFWAKSSVRLDDALLQRLFQRSLYVLGASYRQGPMPGLCGLAYGPEHGPVQATPWGGDYHWDQNAQSPFYPVHVLNHSELFEAYLDTCERMLPEARRLAREIWGAPGAHFDMCFNANGKSVFGGVGRYRFFLAGAYVALPHCLAWRHRRDLEQLRTRIYPFLREVLAFYEYMLEEGDDGRLHLYPGHAPELRPMTTGDPTQTISMLRVCLETAVEAARLLCWNRTETTRWRRMLDRLPDYPIEYLPDGRRAVLDAYGLPPGHSVNQAGGMRPVFPCAEITPESAPAVRTLYRDTRDVALERTTQRVYANVKGYHFQCVWQCFHYAMTALRLGETQRFWNELLPMFVKCFVKPNGLMSHDATVVVPCEASEANLGAIPSGELRDGDDVLPTFEAWCGFSGGASPNPDAPRFSQPAIEANADFLTMIVDTLLQSHGGIVRVFPAWPRERDARFERWVAEGNLLVSAEMRGGEVTRLRLERPAAFRGESDTVRWQCPWTGEVRTTSLPAGAGLDLVPGAVSER